MSLEIRPHAPDASSERRRLPSAARGPYLDAVRAAWRSAREVHDRRHPALALALAAFARDGRAREVPVEVLLRALDTIVYPQDGGDTQLDFSDARDWAGTLLIRRYYGAD
jgi:hypothetical protein